MAQRTNADPCDIPLAAEALSAADPPPIGTAGLRVNETDAGQLAGAQMVGLVYANMPVALAASVVAALFLYLVALPILPLWAGVSWLALILSVSAARLGLARAYARADAGSRDDPRWAGRFVAAAAVSGLAWGASCFLLLGFGTPVYHALAAFVLGGLVAGGIATIAQYWRAYAWFACAALLPLAGGYFWLGAPVYQGMGAMTLLFLVVMLRTARNVNAIYRHDMELSLANAGLVAELTDSAQSLGKANLDLQREVDQRRQIQEKLRLAAKVFDGSIEAIMITDAEGELISVNRAFSEITGYAAAEALGNRSHILRSGMHDEEFYRLIWESLREFGSWRGEVWNRRKTGEIFPSWAAISSVRDCAGRLTNYITVFSDISESKAAADQINFLAHHDPLTGLPNRILLRDRFEHAQEQAARIRAKVALLYLDIDHFKAINSSLGHPAGDELLRVLAERLRGCLRVGDTVCRQGGDEFLVLMGDVADPKAVSIVADKILNALREPLQVSGHPLGVSASIGISLYPDDGDDFDAVLQKADTAMYRAKDAGGGAYRYFSIEMNANALENLQLQNRLRTAIEQGEFLLHYQPQIDLAAGRVVGVEALIRWESPELGMVSPGKFIPVAEASGLIVPIGAWVLNQACRQNRAWQCAGLPEVPIAVNLSALQFTRGDLLATVEDALEHSGLPPHCLELELTESILIRDADTTLKTLQRLKALGVRLSIDDFGTGYSSFAYLRRFAVEQTQDRPVVRARCDLRSRRCRDRSRDHSDGPQPQAQDHCRGCGDR